jgi:Zn-dependent protease with chaperone function
MIFEGKYLDGKSAVIHSVQVDYDLANTLMLRGEGIGREYALKEVKLADPLGRTRFALILPDGGRVEYEDAEAYAALRRLRLGPSPMDWVHRIESKWHWVVGSIAGIILAVFLFFWAGIPLLAKGAAYSLPAEVNVAIAAKAMELLDSEYFAPSGLPPEEQARIRQDFENMVTDLHDWEYYRLEFRSSEAIGANALALPSGIIIITDDLIELADHADEINAVLAHEIAHVKYRHGLQSVLQDVGVFVMLSIMIGDVGVSTSIVTALPTLLIRSGYSREFEEEADRFAGEWLIAEGIGTQPLQDILQKLSEASGGMPIGEILSSHPDLESRLALLQAMEE